MRKASLLFLLCLVFVACNNPTGNDNDPNGELVLKGYIGGASNSGQIILGFTFESTYDVQLNNVYVNVSLACDDSIRVGSATGGNISIPPYGAGTCVISIPYSGVERCQEITHFYMVSYWDYGNLRYQASPLSWVNP